MEFLSILLFCNLGIILAVYIGLRLAEWLYSDKKDRYIGN
jgi:hypothetical protein